MVYYIINIVYFYFWKESYVLNIIFKNGKIFLGNLKIKKIKYKFE